MKRTFFIFLALLIPAIRVISQIVINNADMPVAGDTLRVSITNNVPAGFSKTAMDTTWDFSALEALSQRVDTFVNVTATPFLYYLTFVQQGQANLASPRGNMLLPGLPVSQGFEFFRNSSSSYGDLGSAYTIQLGGFPLPLLAKYDVPDKINEFPMNPGMNWSSVSQFSISLPGLAYISTKRNRTSIVDGWGTVVTPLGTFQALRVKSALNEHDSLYLDTLSGGFPVDRNITEYKWLAKGKGIPVLQVSEENGIATAVYRDIPRMSAQPLTVTLGADTSVHKGVIVTLHVLVSGGTPPYQVLWNTMDTGAVKTVTIQATTTFTVLVVDALQNFGSAQKVVSVIYGPGIWEHTSGLLRADPNPTTGPVRIELPANDRQARLQVFTPQGKPVYEQTINPAGGIPETDLFRLPDGLYILRILTDLHEYHARIILQR